VLASRLLTVWLPVIAWAALIYVLSAQPDLSTGLGTWDTVLRKLAHVAEYAILGALLMRAFSARSPAIAAGIGYAVTDEIHQSFVAGRHAAARDVAIDSIGVVLGVVLFSWAQTRSVALGHRHR
jgi:VanZ family protein